MGRAVSIAVVIPAFNAEKTLARALESVLGQDRSADEIIVVDDGSNDRTREVARAFGDGVQLLCQEHGGPGRARQNGILACETDYVAYLDADDRWPSEKLAECEPILESRSLHFLFADFRRALFEGERETRYPRNRTFFPFLESYLSSDRVEALGDGLSKLSPRVATELLLRGFPAYPSTMVLRRSSALEAGGWSAEFQRSQDLDLSLRLARRHGAHYLDRVMATIGLHEGNVDPQPYVIQQTRGDIEVLQAHLRDRDGTSEYRSAVRRALAARWCTVGYALRKDGKRQEARAAYRAAMSWPGRRVHAFLRWAYLRLS